MTETLENLTNASVRPSFHNVGRMQPGVFVVVFAKMAKRDGSNRRVSGSWNYLPTAGAALYGAPPFLFANVKGSERGWR